MEIILHGTACNMNEFKRYHPIVNFAYFAFAIVFACLFLHPIMIMISLLCGFTYSCMLKGVRQIRKNLMYLLPILLLAALINPAFNHEGVTILAYLPSGNPLTLESVCYGFVSGSMVVSVILFFICFNEIMTSDKFVYLFGRIIPSLSLIISMTLRFVPRFTEQFRNTANYQKCVGRDVSKGSIILRAKNGLKILSIMVTRSLENAIDTSDSMKSRGYGLPGRTAFSIYSFTGRDKKALFMMLLLGIYIIIGNLAGQTFFACFPLIQIADVSAYGLSVFSAYIILLSLPILIEVSEVIKWKFIRSET